MSDHKSRTAETPEEDPRGESPTTDDELKEARMMTVTISHDDGETTIENPNFVDTLCNANDVAVDGEIYSDVNQVVFMHDECEDYSEEMRDASHKAMIRHLDGTPNDELRELLDKFRENEEEWNHPGESATMGMAAEMLEEVIEDE